MIFVTCFENYFYALKKALGNETVYDVWPDFEPQYDEQEYAWTTLRGLGEVLLLNCGVCDGPSDLRHARCKECVNKRTKIANEAYQKAVGRSKEKWSTIFLCRIHTE
ncbi:hypothetical protein CW707_03110 [Candidatus Bathyarchaeota archaeon]|nr:MAG: hypothetical protein CW667_01925 [Candidatus Bathyarchaeota archaeon]RJS81609.1 MAG: hypothetical protein CW707_03110 [Candidatus Bathyarchaeota archaeon]